jgi:hypothetical protein
VGDVAVAVPQEAPEQFAPARDQVTAVLVGPVTVPVNCCVLLTSTLAEAGVTVIVTTVKPKVVLWTTGTCAPSVPVIVTVERPVGVVADVLMVTVEVPVPGKVIVAGLKEQVTPAGPLQVGVIVPE